MKVGRILLLLIALCLSGLSAFSQYKIIFRLRNIPPGHTADSIYAAGNFNNWDPAAKNARLSIADQSASLEITNLAAGESQFKFTRGSWQKVEVAAAGGDVENRLLRLVSDTIIDVSVAAWKDDFASVERKHTASPNVHILDTTFEMPQLSRTRRIWLYLPPGYKKGTKRYPVMYMHDGQNIFDEYTAAFSEWGVDECIDSLVGKDKPACIVVAIDNGARRMNEYNPYEFTDFGKGEGDEYVDFIANTLKPFMDKNYRTLPSRLNTIVAGSSMGGLISYYAMLKYPEIFGKAGIFSPAFWTADKIQALTESNGSQLKGKLFFYMGGLEGVKYLADMKKVTDKLGSSSPAMVYAVIDPLGSHNEQAWRKWFPEFCSWILAEGFNNIISVED